MSAKQPKPYVGYAGQNGSGKVFDPAVSKPLGRCAPTSKPIKLHMAAQPDGAMIIAWRRD